MIAKDDCCSVWLLHTIERSEFLCQITVLLLDHSWTSLQCFSCYRIETIQGMQWSIQSLTDVSDPGVSHLTVLSTSVDLNLSAVWDCEWSRTLAMLMLLMIRHLCQDSSAITAQRNRFVSWLETGYFPELQMII